MKFLRPKNLWGAFNSDIGTKGEKSQGSALGNLMIETGDVEEFECPCSTLDHELMNQVSRLDLLKVDVDGPELDVLKGATGLIQKFHPVIVSEASIFARDKGIPISENLTFLKDHGYIIFGTARGKPNIHRVSSLDEPWLKELIDKRIDLDLFCYYPETRDQKWNDLWFVKSAIN